MLRGLCEWAGAYRAGRSAENARCSVPAALYMQVCSSWTAVNRGTSRRSAATPLGDTAVASVALGNLLAVRSAILIWVLEAAGAVWIVEQPLSSLLWHHPRMEGVLRGLRCFRLTVCMCDFGAPTLKPTLLVGNVASLGELSEWRVP